MTMISDILAELEASADETRAQNASLFFKTGEGQYGYGDQFIGVTVPAQRAIAKKHKDASPEETKELLRSPWHEARLTALFILVYSFQKGSTSQKAAIYDAYIKNKQYINNWDLVDSSAPYIVGEWLHGKSKDILIELAKSDSLWDRRIAILATFYDIKHQQPASALKIADLLLHDNEDLIQKAVGWMLREVGKRCDKSILVDFLQSRYKTMPRTELRYAIEHFSPTERSAYLKGNV